MKPSPRVMGHRPLDGMVIDNLHLGPEEEEDKFVNRPCFQFNPKLSSSQDDAHCTHCRMYLTAQCPHIDEFLDDVEDYEPE
ncbi:MAG: hypothetical protein L3K03_04110 [Thermoplasmata archaeon]|nr:hypothetical protein [Thermoplasmata archaeon]